MWREIKLNSLLFVAKKQILVYYLNIWNLREYLTLF